MPSKTIHDNCSAENAGHVDFYGCGQIHRFRVCKDSTTFGETHFIIPKLTRAAVAMLLNDDPLIPQEFTFSSEISAELFLNPTSIKIYNGVCPSSIERSQSKILIEQDLNTDRLIRTGPLLSPVLIISLIAEQVANQAREVFRGNKDLEQILADIHVQYETIN